MALPIARRVHASYLRNFIFGVEDSLVSTVGLLSGVAAAGSTRSMIIITGAVLIFVEAFSMAVGSFLAEASAEEYELRREAPVKQVIVGGAIMFGSYFLSGLIPLAPYVAMDSTRALWWSIAVSLGALFALGLVGARIAHVSLVRHGVRMLTIGGIAIAVGVMVGVLLKQQLM